MTAQFEWSEHWDRNVVTYAAYYFKRYNELCTELATLPGGSHPYTEPIAAVLVKPAEDGVAIFYLPEATAIRLNIEPGKGQSYNPADKSLAYVIQAMTENVIRVPAPLQVLLKADHSNIQSAFDVPPELPHTDIMWHSISKEIIDAFKNQQTIHIEGIPITPERVYQNGLVVDERPTRNHVFSPAIALPDKRIVRFFEWICADFIWHPQNFDLTPENAARFADIDVEVLRLGIEAGLPPEGFSQDPFGAVANHLLSVCQEFEDLLDGPDVDEGKVQTFLEQRHHHFLLSPNSKAVHPHKVIGGGRLVPDFALVRPDGDWHLIEIENPNGAIYQEKGQERSAHLIHAEQQVKDWLRYVDDNRETVRREDGFEGIYKPTGEVIAGRDKQLGKDATQRFAYERANNPVALKTYDMKLQEARAYAQNLLYMKNT